MNRLQLNSFSFYQAVLLLLLFTSTCVYGENALTVEAKTDTNHIRIGEQFHLDFTAVGPKGSRISFPILPDTFNHFELVSRGKIDTLTGSNASILSLKQRLTLTSFDTGFFVIPPFHFLLNTGNRSDSASTEAMLMGVTTIPVDTTKEIRDIKSTMDVPFPWEIYIPFAIGIILLSAIAYFIYRKIKARPKPEEKVIVASTRPAHEIALEKLQETENDKLWQQGFYKQYHIAVADILRVYIEMRFQIPAMEYTTVETLQAFRTNILKEEDKIRLQNLLVLADMVKFAKVHPLPHENEQSMQDALLFVNNTRSVIQEDFTGKEVAS